MNYFKNAKPITGISMLFVMAFTLACSSEDPDSVNEEEVITTVSLQFTNNGQTDEVITATFRDFDGPGGEVPTVDDITLNANSSYTLDLSFLNESATPTEDITAEVRAGALEHQVFYIASNTVNITYTYGDEDSLGNPVGINGTVTTRDVSNGTLSVVLIHKPNKSATGVASGNIGNADGEEDVRVQFNIRIE